MHRSLSNALGGIAMPCLLTGKHLAGKGVEERNNCDFERKLCDLNE
jgi:hypothetical protein